MIEYSMEKENSLYFFLSVCVNQYCCFSLKKKYKKGARSVTVTILFLLQELLICIFY